MAHPKMFDDDDPVLARVRRIALSFPDAADKVSHGQPAFFTTKVFAYYGGSQKLPAGGHVRHDASLLVLAPADERQALLQDPRFFTPMYLGPSGWVGLRLDDQTDWTEVRELIDASYRLTAGVRRVRRLDAGDA
ncbi:MmcQ/YjbR family DNA-binding protein [Aeromicrobium sp. CTD01-1L150]|uniref:MmcQ/YjbR family DNA-binding protein n=1 Tax=Aeromicrobium sp. CTD01-1L150 TaxID=3341830 RepID=UPI0035C1F7D9